MREPAQGSHGAASGGLRPPVAPAGRPACLLERREAARLFRCPEAGTIMAQQITQIAYIHHGAVFA